MSPRIEPVRADFAGRVLGPSAPGGRGDGRVVRRPVMHRSPSGAFGAGRAPGRERPERAKWGKVMTGSILFVT